jgi:hypothetical protein
VGEVIVSFERTVTRQDLRPPGELLKAGTDVDIDPPIRRRSQA